MTCTSLLESVNNCFLSNFTCNSLKWRTGNFLDLHHAKIYWFFRESSLERTRGSTQHHHPKKQSGNKIGRIILTKNVRSFPVMLLLKLPKIRESYLDLNKPLTYGINSGTQPCREEVVKEQFHRSGSRRFELRVKYQ